MTQLGNEVSIIIEFIGSRAQDRRDRWRAKYEDAMHREANELRLQASLVEEMALIHQINTREEMWAKIATLAC